MRGFEVRLVSLGAYVVRVLAGVTLILLVCSGTWAQKNKKNQPAADQPMPSMPMTPNEEVEHNIG